MPPPFDDCKSRLIEIIRGSAIFTSSVGTKLQLTSGLFQTALLRLVWDLGGENEAPTKAKKAILVLGYLLLDQEWFAGDSSNQVSMSPVNLNNAV